MDRHLSRGDTIGRVVQTRYCSIARLGYWGAVDAKCETMEPDELGLVSHHVHFVLLDQHGERASLGYSIFGGWPDRAEVFDENGETHPSLDAAIRSHCEQNMIITPKPGRWVAHKP